MDRKFKAMHYIYHSMNLIKKKLFYFIFLNYLYLLGYYLFILFFNKHEKALEIGKTQLK